MDRLHRLMARSPDGVRRLLRRVPGASLVRDRIYGSPGGEDPRPGSLRPVVYLPTWAEWEVMKQRPQYLLEAMAAAGHDVWFVDPRLSEARTVSERIRLVPSIRSTPRSGVILYTHFAPTRTLIHRYQDPVVIYDLLDDLAIYDDSERGMARERTVKHHHHPLMDKADVVIVSNPVLFERHRTERDDLLLIANGVDLGRFTMIGPVAGSLPEGLIVGFHGALAPWIDFDLLNAVVRLRPALRFVFVGPVDPLVREKVAELSTLPNVHLLPARPSDLIAEFVRGFRVGILPFVIDEMTEAVTPLKMYEYLASGVPTVATPLPACVDHPAVRTASDPKSFVAEIDAALEMTGEERAGLRAHAEKADWKQRIVPVLERLDQSGLRTVS